MTTLFPQTKEDFTADNGVTYTWDVNRWRTKAYKLDESKLDEYLPLTGGDLSGKLTVRKIREDRNTIAMSILGQVRDNDNAIINDVLFKSYQREIGSPQADYIAYYGSGGGANEILNRKTAQSEFASKTAFEELEQAVDDIEIPPAADPIELDGYLELAGGTMTGDIAMDGNRVTALADPIQPSQAATKRYTDAEYALSMKRFGNNDVATGRENEDTVFRIRGIRANGNFFTTMSINSAGMGIYNLVRPTEGHHAATKDYVDDAIADIDLDGGGGDYLPLSGGTLTNQLTFNRGNKASVQFAIEPNSGTQDTNIYSFSGGQMRLRSTHTDSIDDRVGSHIVLDPNGGAPETKIYNVIEPTNDNMAANKKYVDDQRAIAVTGTSIAPSLATGQLYWNTTNKVLYIGN